MTRLGRRASEVSWIEMPCPAMAMDSGSLTREGHSQPPLRFLRFIEIARQPIKTIVAPQNAWVGRVTMVSNVHANR